jgi:hypothetical protein
MYMVKGRKKESKLITDVFGEFIYNNAPLYKNHQQFLQIYLDYAIEHKSDTIEN